MANASGMKKRAVCRTMPSSIATARRASRSWNLFAVVLAGSVDGGGTGAPMPLSSFGWSIFGFGL